MVLVRIKARRVLKEDAEEMLTAFDKALEVALGKSGKALVRHSYKICAAYRHVMTMYLTKGKAKKIPELKPSAHTELQEFNDQAVTNIPGFMADYKDGKIPYEWVSEMPNISKAFAQTIEVEAKVQVKERNEADPKHARPILSGSIEKYVTKFNKLPSDQKKLIIESAIMGYGQVTKFFESVETEWLNTHHVDLKAQIQRLLELELS